MLYLQNFVSHFTFKKMKKVFKIISNYEKTAMNHINTSQLMKNAIARLFGHGKVRHRD